MRRTIAAVVLAVVFVCAAGFWLLTIALDESRSMSRYALDSFILVPGVLRDLPEVELEGEVTFHSSCGDGRRRVGAGDPALPARGGLRG